MYEIAHKLKADLPGTAVISVTFSFFSELWPHSWEHEFSASALCRRIAFVALERSDYTNSISQYRKHMEYARVDREWVENWLGDTPCVLLIDYLDLIMEFGPTGPNSESVSEMLRSVFLNKPGRYFVFTTQDPTIHTKLVEHMDSTSDRLIIKKQLPLITSMSTAVTKLSSAVTAPQAIFYGLVPGLVFLANHEPIHLPTQRRSRIVRDWIKSDPITDNKVVSLLSVFITGDREGIPKDLMGFMDVTNDGLVRWIPFHLMYMLNSMKSNLKSKLSRKMSGNVNNIIRLLKDFKEEKTKSDDGWESLFVFVLFVRALTGQTHNLLGFETIPVNTQVHFKIYSMWEEKTLESFFDKVPETVKTGPQLSVYYFGGISLQGYDCFLVFWDAQGHRSFIIGYQLKKETKTTPRNEPSQRVSKSFAIRGRAVQNDKNRQGWVIPSPEALDEFFGVSGREWTPKQWNALLTQ